MNILITGISGFAGSFLAEYILKAQSSIRRLADKAQSLFGTVFSARESSNLQNIEDQLHLFAGDLSDRGFVKKVLDESCPDLIFHLAAIAFVGESLKNPEKVILNNIQIQLNLLEEIRAQGLKPKILIVGSADEYGLVAPADNPLSENQPLLPVSPYGLSKLAQDMMGYVYYKSYGLPIVRVRPFNHIGPRQSSLFVVPAFAKQIAEAEADLAEPTVKVGNLSAKRDFCDVRDMVKAYWLALEKGQIGDVYNLGSGKAYAISWVLETLISYAKIKIKIQKDPSRLRAVDLPVTMCNQQKFAVQTLWKPTFSIEETLLETLNYWREKVKMDAGRK